MYFMASDIRHVVETLCVGALVLHDPVFVEHWYIFLCFLDNLTWISLDNFTWILLALQFSWLGTSGTSWPARFVSDEHTGPQEQNMSLG